MKKSLANATPSFIEPLLGIEDSYSFAGRPNVASPNSLFEIGVRIGRVEQMLADNRAALRGAR